MSPIKTFPDTIKTTLKKPRALLLFALLYAVLLVSFYFFLSTREATVWQVLLTYVLLIVIPSEFFLLQAAIIDSARDLGFSWQRTPRHALKIFVVTIAILIIGWVLWYYFNKLAARWPAPVPAPSLEAKPPKPVALHWASLLFATLRFLIFGVALPLTAIQLWIEVTARDVRATFAGGAKAFLKRLGHVITRAFSSESVLTYGLGLIVFALLPYVFLFTPLTVKGNKTDFTVFILRLVLAFVLTLFGWVLMLTALVRSKPAEAEPEIVVAPTPAEAPA